jgi:hypothetical protein
MATGTRRGAISAAGAAAIKMWLNQRITSVSFLMFSANTEKRF